MITTEKATENGTKVYQTLLRQGRAEADARRDAEQWVMGNHGIEITLESPSGLASDIEDILNRAARNTVRTETQRPSYSQPHSCPTCGMSWPFSGRCENCKRDSYEAESKRTRRSKGAQKAAASRKRNKARKDHEDLTRRWQAGDSSVTGSHVRAADQRMRDADDAYWKKMQDINSQF